MTRESRRLAAIPLVVYPTVVLGGLSILRLLIGREAGDADTRLLQDLRHRNDRKHV